MKRAKRPLELSFRLAWYLLKNRLRGRKRFPPGDHAGTPGNVQPGLCRLRQNPGSINR